MTSKLPSAKGFQSNVEKQALHFSKVLFLSLFLSITLFPASLQAQEKVKAGISLTRISRLENFVKEQIAAGQIPGAVTLVMRNGEVVQQGAYGLKNINEKTPAGTEDLFYIQSMTKPIISVAFMMLYEEGHFMLTDPVSKYLPGFKDLRVVRNLQDGIGGASDPLQSEMTIAQLLSHSSGLTHGLDRTPFDEQFMKGYFRQPWTDIRSRAITISSFPLLAQPGTKWSYSAGPDVLSLLIEQFSGMSTNDFLTERIFKPLGMANTFYNVPKADLPRIFQLHSAGEKGTMVLAASQPKAEGVTLWSGVNGLFSTARDYATFCQMLLNNGTLNGKRILSRKTIELMTSNHVGGLFNRSGEGFGLGFAVVTDAAGTRLPGSNGLYYWGGANNTHFFVDPKEKLIAILMTQESHFSWNWHDKLRQLVYQSVAD
ncbi:MAG: serine hydrolase domain-containing protein [Bacteroidota bacterium]